MHVAVANTAVEKSDVGAHTYSQAAATRINHRAALLPCLPGFELDIPSTRFSSLLVELTAVMMAVASGAPDSSLSAT